MLPEMSLLFLFLEFVFSIETIFDLYMLQAWVRISSLNLSVDSDLFAGLFLWVRSKQCDQGMNSAMLSKILHLGIID